MEQDTQVSVVTTIAYFDLQHSISILSIKLGPSPALFDTIQLVLTNWPSKVLNLACVPEDDLLHRHLKAAHLKVPHCTWLCGRVRVCDATERVADVHDR